MLIMAVAIGIAVYGYRIWSQKQHHVDMSINGTLILPNGVTQSMTVDVTGYLNGDDYSLRFTATDNPYFSFAKRDVEGTFDDAWDIPYIFMSVGLYEEKVSNRHFWGYCALSEEEGLLLFYTKYIGEEKVYGDKVNYIFYGSVNGDYTLEEMQEYFAIFHRDFGN